MILNWFVSISLQNGSHLDQEPAIICVPAGDSEMAMASVTTDYKHYYRDYESHIMDLTWIHLCQAQVCKHPFAATTADSPEDLWPPTIWVIVLLIPVLSVWTLAAINILNPFKHSIHEHVLIGRSNFLIRFRQRSSSSRELELGLPIPWPQRHWRWASLYPALVY